MAHASECPWQPRVGTHGSCVRSLYNREDFINRDFMCQDLPKRKSPRAFFHDYSGGGYFVTICTKNRIHYLGEIINGEMHLSEIGEFCASQLENIKRHYPYVEVPIFVVMPNHIHAIIYVNNTLDRTHEPCVPTSARRAPDSGRTHELALSGTEVPAPDSGRTHEPCVPTLRSLLSVIIGGIKRSVTLFSRKNNINFGWQPRYHDHIIRNDKDGNNISQYIENNVGTWQSDCFY